MTLQFVVHGSPAPQGSKTKWGTEDNPHTRPWRAAVAAEAAAAMNGHKVLVGPVRINLKLFFKRPQGHFRTGKHAGELKDSAPRYVATKPDVDKCVRAIADSLSGIAFHDDSQVACLHAEKFYGAPRAEIVVFALTPQPQ